MVFPALFFYVVIVISILGLPFNSAYLFRDEESDIIQSFHIIFDCSKQSLIAFNKLSRSGLLV